MDCIRHLYRCVCLCCNSECDAEEEMLPHALDAQKMIIYLPGSGIPELAIEVEGIAPDSLYFKEIADDYMQSLTITAEMIQFIEKSTREQSADQLWLALHNGRITSSLFGEILHRRDTTNAASLVSRIMGYNRLQYPAAAMKWGTEHERTAQVAYIHHRRQGGCEVTITNSGLTLSQSHPFLGASGDGFVSELGCEGQGVLEVKTVYTIDNVNVTNIHPRQLASNPKCCLEITEGKVQLKRNHNYYYQVQGELAIMGAPWCDFVVWTKAGIFIERITLDNHLWSNIMLPKLTQFYVEHVVPEILLRPLQKSLL